MQRTANIMNFDFEAMKRKIRQRLESSELSDKLISRSTLAGKLGVAISTTYRWQKEGFLPEPHFKRGKTKRWSENEIDLWWKTAKEKV